MASDSSDVAPARRSLSSGGLLPRRSGVGSLADPAARKWVVLGALGIVSSLLLTVAVALLSGRGVASADVPATAAAPANRVTMVREVGGAPRSSPTPSVGMVASAPAEPGSATAAGGSAASVNAATSAAQSVATNALRQLRRVGRAIVTADGIRHLALGGAVPFTDGGTVTAMAPAGAESTADALADAGVTLGETSVFFRLAVSGADAFIDSMNSMTQGRQDAVVLASPVAISVTSTTRAEQVAATATTVPATAVPATATSVPATATSVPATATSVPPTAVAATATAIPATATAVLPTATPPPSTAQPIPTAVPATATPVVVTATPLPATQTPIIITATPEPTRRATRTPTPEVVVVTATPSSLFPNGLVPNVPSNMIPWLTGQPTATPPPAFVMGPPATPAPTNTPIPTATFYVVPDPRSAPVTAVPAAPAVQAQASAPRQTESAPPTPAGPAPILAESGTRTPLNPTPHATPRQAAPNSAQGAQAPATPGSVAQAQGQGQPNDATRDPSVLEKLATRALLAVNAARAQAGALPLARNAAMDTASVLHAQYDVATGQAEGNFQTRGAPLFMGETPSARVARAAGSRGAGFDRVAEVMALGEAEPERAVQGWLDSVYHRVLLLDLAAQYAGYGQQTAGNATSAVLDVGGKRDVANASGWFPASGATDVPTRCACDDYADATGKPGPYGYPVTLLLGQVRPQGMPTLVTLSENDENGPAVATTVVDAYGNPTVLPQAPLKPNTKYVVHLAWTNGPAVTWSFTTAAQ